jgi:hypothetical protein
MVLRRLITSVGAQTAPTIKKDDTFSNYAPRRGLARYLSNLQDFGTSQLVALRRIYTNFLGRTEGRDGSVSLG